jgi:HK97 family phage major capsid protein
MSFTIPTMGTAPTVATVAEGGAPSETGMTSSYTTVSVIKKSGINRVSFELLERSRPAFADLLLEEMRKAYAKNTDEYVIAQMTAGGTQATATAGTVAGLQSFIATEAPAAWAATGGEFATTLLANQAWWTALVSANDTAGRPLYPSLSPSNAPGAVGVGASNGIVLGTDFRVDQNITAGLIDESAFLLAPSAVAIWESPVTTLRVNVLTSGEVEIGMHGYIACSVLKAGGVRRFNLT